MSLTRDWWLPRLTARTALLVPFSWLFGALSAARRLLYRLGILATHRLPVPVIVVGNLTVGGSGKTPLGIALVKHLQAAGYRPGVISRGYGGTQSESAAPLHVTPQSLPALAGDEPVLIAKATGVPVVVDANRFLAGQFLLANHPSVDVIVSDDGLQHYALGRDISLAVFDDRGVGNCQMLPAGPLREPLSQAAGLTALVHNGLDGNSPKTSLHQRFPGMHAMRLEPRAAYQLVAPERRAELTTLRGRGKIAAVAGIGNPERFFVTLRSAGLAFLEKPFPDHHPFAPNDIENIDADVVLMTEKDALKCATFEDERIWVLPVEAQLESSFFELILETLRGRKAA